MPEPRRGHGSVVDPVLVGTAALALYASTSSPFVSHEDMAQFQALSAAPGIAHAGYPLLTLALELAHRLPFGSIAYRANLVSATCGALAVALAMFSILRATGSRAAAWVASFALMLGYSLWHEATRAEVYAFTLPLAAGAFLALAAHLRSGSRGALFACFLLVGLGFTSHLSILAIATVAAIVLLARLFRREASWRDLGVAGLGFAIGLTPFLVTLARDVPGAPMNYLDYTFDRFSGTHIPWAADAGTRLRRLGLLLSGRQFLETGWFYPFKDALIRLKLVAYNVALNDFFAAGSLAAAAGVVLAARRRAVSDLLLLGWLAALLFWLGFGAYPVVLSSFFLPGLWILAHFIGLALASLAHRRLAFAGVAAAVLGAAALRPFLASPPPGIATRPLAVATWLQMPAEWSPFRHDQSWDQYGRAVLEAVEPRSAILFCWDEGAVLMYFQHGERLRPGVVLRPACNSPGRLEAAIADARREGRPVYSTIPPERLSGDHDWAPAGAWPRGRLWKLR